MKKIYISGKISGLPSDQVQAKFKAAANEIRRQGLIDVNPFEIVKSILLKKPELLKLSDDQLWNFAMKICIIEMLNCNAVLLLDDWQSSKGAQIEYRIAKELGIKTIIGTKELSKKLTIND